MYIDDGKGKLPTGRREREAKATVYLNNETRNLGQERATKGKKKKWKTM
jgi:hypothetical protein